MPRAFCGQAERRFLQIGELVVHVVILQPLSANSYVVVGDTFSTLASPDPHAVVLDLPGTGGSSPWSGKRTYGDYVELAKSTARELALDSWRVLTPAAGDISGQLSFFDRFAVASAPRADGAHLASSWDLVRACEIFGSFAHRTGDRRNRERALAGAEQLHDRTVALAAAPEVVVAHARALRGEAVDFSFSKDDLNEGPVRRSYVQISSGRVHLRTYGARAGNPIEVPLFVLHPSPGSALPYAAVSHAFAQRRTVFAPDMLGNGDSDGAPMTAQRRTIRDYANDAAETIRALTGGPVDVWGTHTGALVAMELAISHPTLVRRLVMDGITLFDQSTTTDFLTNYLPPFLLDAHGAHLLRAWGMVHDMMLFWPWYRQNPEGARTNGALPTDVLHERVVDLLRSGPTFRAAYEAAFSYPAAERLPLLGTPTMLSAHPTDPLRVHLPEAKKIQPGLELADTFGLGPEISRSVEVYESWFEQS